MGLMHTRYYDPLEAKERADPVVTLAQLLGRSFDVTITPEQIEELFRRHWGKLSPLAHAVHDIVERKGGKNVQ